MPIAAKDVFPVAQARTPLFELALLADVKRGLADIAAGRTEDADTAIGRLQQASRLAAKATRPPRRRSGVAEPRIQVEAGITGITGIAKPPNSWTTRRHRRPWRVRA